MVLCLLALFVGSGLVNTLRAEVFSEDEIAKEVKGKTVPVVQDDIFLTPPPLTDKEPLCLLRIQTAKVPSYKQVANKIEFLLEYFEDTNEAAKYLHKDFERTGDYLLSAWFDLLKTLRANKALNFFIVFEPDTLWDGREDHEPFFAINLRGLENAQVESVRNAVKDFAKEIQISRNSEITLIDGDKYLVTNLMPNETFAMKELDYLKKKITTKMLPEWPIDVRDGLAKYQNCVISAVGSFPPAFYREIQDGIERIKEDENAQDYVKAMRKSLRDFRSMNYYAMGFDFETMTLSISVIMETDEDAEDVKVNSLKTLTEMFKFARKTEHFVFDEKDIEKFVNSIQVSQSGNVVTFSFSEQWLKDQKSFLSKWEREVTEEEDSVKGDDPAP